MPAFAIGTVGLLCAVKLLIHAYDFGHYGYFRDELYYLACSRHLNWGYVDQPPLIALIAWLIRAIFGDSLPAIRVPAALAGAGLVALSALIARELGGKRTAQTLAALATLCGTGLLATDGFFSMNAFEPLFWAACAWLVIRVIRTGDQRLWIWFGILAGLGLENKYSMGLFGAGIVAGLILTPARRVFASPWIWIGGAIAFVLFLPNLIWNVQHHFPFLELQANIRRSGRDVALKPWNFFAQEIGSMQPLTLAVWLSGLWFFFSRRGRQFRALGWAWIFTAAVIAILSPRVYYLFPAFPVLFAAGGVMWESVRRWRWFVWPEVMAVTTLALAPFAIPLMPPETYIRYAKALHFEPPAIETMRLGPLPQLFADEFGWEDMAATVARVYHNLPPDLRAKTAIFGQNYGEAGAIDFFGPKYGLPPAISGHQSYFLWGPREYTGESVIVLGSNERDLARQFAEVQNAGSVENKYSMPYEHVGIFYCRGLKQPLSELWPKVKNWD